MAPHIIPRLILNRWNVYTYIYGVFKLNWAFNSELNFFSDLSNDHNQPSSGESGGGDSDTESRGGKGSSNKKRGLFPKQATNILRAWLFQNLSVSITKYASEIGQNWKQPKTRGIASGVKFSKFFNLALNWKSQKKHENHT